MANAQARQEREAEARAADLAAKKGAMMRRMMVSQLYCPYKVLVRENFTLHTSANKQQRCVEFRVRYGIGYHHCHHCQQQQHQAREITSR